ncbi:hypothetical protein COW36_15630 [bacterium (Candidatus Blackallbacteria) CG17_big_fil_post_rev_8_21_14_2_50_48_46]|uniref:PKD domain-containing protein n=1 Tax=bacterium (Candidatus Blackallbacteria) CG17_big_fil_post_rev_8_21_14_2_50_48_46 TaxID=2014261 RepID=A0A2M7G2G1_9BACT|nr:MAG: hypothetical protein COW64_07605 [bacterium (Candidatus Blackallbacteria) CG18_big_fil_WC_8_21_14_2_50_49_26]PIW15899.1 MAG: hypothetical protein COW36_15630 [bacterium (Candidatus Blackallbacteria) CG17_big_fil_post_rev_8_21_14_2_50_48_46]PIW48636.1 MAG: hypothetical protein COW20_08540 [bacterium (Candidatus Blackallbacteria) CG13_big_fil_rev_8_21_14_2_50_49_14]
MIHKRFKSSRRLIRTEQGLSIIEVMAAGTILAIIAVGAASFVPTAFKANKKSRDLTASTQVMNQVMEQLNSIDFKNATPYPFASEPVYTTANPQAVINTTTLNASNPVTVCLERVSGSTTCAPGKTLSFPLKIPLNNMNYRVDLIVYKGKHAYLAELPERISQTFALAGLPTVFQTGIESLSEFLVPPAQAAGCAVAATPTSAEVGTAVTFTGVNTYNPEGNVRWTFQDSPATQTTVATPPFAASKTWGAAGTYNVTMEAIKSNGTSPINCSGSPVTVNVTNPAPVDFTVLPGLTSYTGVTFNFSVNTTQCPLCTAQNTTWDMPGCTPSTGTGLTTFCSYSSPGSRNVYIKRNGISVGSKTLTVNSANVQIVTPVLTTHGVGQTVSFAATCSSCGSNPLYEWNFGDGNSQTGQTATHAYSTTGSPTASVTLRDGSVTPNVTIGTASLPLTIISGTSAFVNVTPASGVAGPVSNPSTTNFTFQTGSTGFGGAPNNPTNAPVTYSIWYGDGNATNAAADDSTQDTNPTDLTFPVFNHKYTDCGNYTATVKAEVGSTVQTGTTSVNLSSVALITASATTVQAGNSVTFTGSTVGNGSTNTYNWTFNDDSSTQTGPSVSHTFSSSGVFTVGMNVTGGCAPSATSQIVVTADPNSIASNQHYMKKIIVKVSPWSNSPPGSHDYLGSAVFMKADNDD